MIRSKLSSLILLGCDFCGESCGGGVVLSCILIHSIQSYNLKSRLLIFGFIFSLIFFKKNINFKKLQKLPLSEWSFLALRALVYYLFGVVFYTQALLLTKIGNVALIGAIPTTAILGFILLKEPVTLGKLTLVLFALLSAFFVSLGFISRKWQSKKFNDQETSTFMLLFAAIFIFITSLIKSEGLPLSNWHLGILAALLIGGLLNAGVSFFMNYGFSRIRAVLASNIIALEPVFASFFAFLIFREILILKEIVGGIVIILSAIIMNNLEAKEKS